MKKERNHLDYARRRAARLAGDGDHVGSQSIYAVCDEAERLQAIVDKLPKTADGVPVVLLMNLWCRKQYAQCIQWVGIGVIGMETNEEDADGGEYCERATLAVRDGRGHEWYVESDVCYSTREAAEAAKEKPNNKQEQSDDNS